MMFPARSASAAMQPSARRTSPQVGQPLSKHFRAARELLRTADDRLRDLVCDHGRGFQSRSENSAVELSIGVIPGGTFGATPESRQPPGSVETSSPNADLRTAVGSKPHDLSKERRSSSAKHSTDQRSSFRPVAELPTTLSALKVMRRAASRVPTSPTSSSSPHRSSQKRVRFSFHSGLSGFKLESVSLWAASRAERSTRAYNPIERR